MAPRLPRYSRVDPVTAGWEIEKDTRTVINEVAAFNNLSAGAMLDQLAKHMPVDSDGRLIWLSSEGLNDGELPIDAA